MNDYVFDCSIIIVTYNAKEYMKKCIDSIYEYTKGISFEIIVSDNASTDGVIPMIRSMYKDIIVIENEHNIGFGAANNKALKIARGKYVLFLNEDTELKNNAIKMFFDYFESNSSKIGALGGYLQFPNGDSNISSSTFPTYNNLLKQMIIHNIHDIIWGVGLRLRINSMGPFLKTSDCHTRTNDSYDVQEVDYICGADLFMKNNADAEFDERFFLYFEETDLQLRLKEKQLKRLLIPGPQIVHYGGGSQMDQKRGVRPIFNYQLSAVKYAKKNLKTDARILKYLIYFNWNNYYLKELVRSKRLKEALKQI